MSKDLTNVTDEKQDSFLEEFEQIQQAEQDKQEQAELERLFDEVGNVRFENITADDILNNKYLYKYVNLIIDDDAQLSEYTTSLRQVAKKFKLTTDFDSKMKAYVKKAEKQLKQAEQAEKQQALLLRAESFPDWWDGQTIDEDKFCTQFLQGRDLRCINDFVYDVNGLYDERKLANEIYIKVKSYIKKGISDRVQSILRTLKVKCYSPPLPCDMENIHLANGTLKTDGSFTNEKFFCTNRLCVNAPEQYTEPKMWLNFLDELLEQEDVLTLQEYMGYCLIPCTKAQKMLMIIGNGGEGKSRIGVIMQKMFGYGSLVTGDVKDLDNGSKARFAREKLVSRLVLLDDDLDLAALASTSFLKQLITAEIPSEVDIKCKSGIQTMLFSRVIAFGNGAISSLYDKSDGFYRRQIILTAKPIKQGRKTDRFLTDKLITELDNIFIWCFQGLKRLIQNGYNFTISQQALQNLEDSKRESNNIIAFMESCESIKLCQKSTIPISTLYNYYERWCGENAEHVLSKKTLSAYLKANCKKYNILYKETVYYIGYDGAEHHARGFEGIKDLHPYVKGINTLEV